MMASNNNRNNLNVGMRCIKYMLIVINILFVLTAVLLLTLGTAVQTIYTDFSHFLNGNFMSVPALLVAIGFIMLLVSTFGVIGALRESTMLTNIYGVLLSIVFILEFAAAIAAFTLPKQTEGMLTKTMWDALENYNTNTGVRDAVDFMQSRVGCCGVDSISDWTVINGTYPESCCMVTDFDPITMYAECEKYFSNGCLNRMKFIISQAAVIIATGATTVAFVQLFGVICAFMLAKTIRRTKSLRAARAWQLQQGLGILPPGFATAPTITKPTYDDYTQLEKSDQHKEPVIYHAR